MLLRCCLIHITIIILRPILYLVYLCPCLGLCLFISYLCDLFYIFSLIFIFINYITSLKQTYLFLPHFLEYLPFFFLMITWMNKANNFWMQKFSFRVFFSFCLVFRQFQTSVAYKIVAYKKRMEQRKAKIESPFQP